MAAPSSYISNLRSETAQRARSMGYSARQTDEIVEHGTRKAEQAYPYWTYNASPQNVKGWAEQAGVGRPAQEVRENKIDRYNDSIRSLHQKLGWLMQVADDMSLPRRFRRRAQNLSQQIRNLETL